MKTCNKCQVLKTDEDFYFINSKKLARRATCILCSKKYHEDNIETIKKQRKLYRENNKELFRERNITAKRREQNRLSKQRTKSSTNIRERNKRKNNPAWKLRKYLSSKVTRALKSNGSCKQMSFLKFVPYTMDEFKLYLKSKFETWMTWENHGPYKRETWNDNDQSTWTWSIDHIIPQSTLPYTSMEDDNFKLCWSLNNLRPLSSKQNLLEGVTGIRHNSN
jgi:hypothetical protein